MSLYVWKTDWSDRGITKEKTVQKLKEAIDSFNEVCQSEDNLYQSPVSIKEIYEFLTKKGSESNPLKKS